MIYRLSDAKTKLARHTREGRRAEDPEVVEDINEAIFLLMQEAHWRSLLARICIKVQNNCLCLPRGFESVIKVNNCKSPANVFSQFYEFLGAGPGTLGPGDSTTCHTDIVDQGDGFPTFFPLSPNASTDHLVKIVALSTSLDDVGKEIKVRGIGKYKEDIYATEGELGETIQIGRFKEGVEGAIHDNDLQQYLSSVKYQEVTSVIKPVTKGYVTLYGYEPTATDGHPRFIFLAKYHPAETSPGYRRYLVTASHSTQVDTLTLLCKMRFEPLSDDDDILQIQHISSLRMMLKAQHEINFGDINKGILWQQNAVRMLDKQLSNTSATGNEIDVEMGAEFKPASMVNLI